MATKRKRRKRRRRQTDGTPPTQPRAPAVALDDAQRARTARRRAGHERPPAPWGDFPLSEIVIFIGILLLIAGFFIPPPRGFVMIAVGLGLGSLAGLELSLREHFAGFRSHSSLLAGAAAVVVDIPLYFLTKLPQEALLGVAVAVFLVAFQLLRSAFRHRAGGLGFRA
jgi:hypothetical protein